MSPEKNKAVLVYNNGCFAVLLSIHSNLSSILFSIDFLLSCCLIIAIGIALKHIFVLLYINIHL